MPAGCVGAAARTARSSLALPLEAFAEDCRRAAVVVTRARRAAGLRARS